MSRATWIILVASVLSGIAGYAASRIWFAPENLTERYINTASATENGMPELDLVDLDGAPVTNAALAGKAVLINFWATWCAPCRREMPHLMEAHAELAAAGLPAIVVGIAIDEAEPVKSYTAELGINYPIAVAGDLAGTRLAQAFGNQQVLLPFSVYVRPDGVIDEVRLGEVTREEVVERLTALIAERG